MRSRRLLLLLAPCLGLDCDGVADEEGEEGEAEPGGAGLDGSESEAEDCGCGNGGVEAEAESEAPCAFSACGGSPVGSWEIVSACRPPERVWIDDRCADPERFVELQGGVLTFERSGRVQLEVSLSAAARFHVADDCPAIPGELTCLEHAREIEIDGNRAVCEQVPGGCDCEAASPPFDYRADGTWYQDGDAIRIGFGCWCLGDRSRRRDLCVTDDVLELGDVDYGELSLTARRR